MPMGPGEPGQGIYKDPKTGRPIVGSAFDQQARQYESYMPQLGLTGSPTNARAYLSGLQQGGTQKPGGSSLGPNRPRSPGTVYASGGGGGGGGGGGSPSLNQGQIDWLAQLLKGSRPTQQTANNITLPQYQAYQSRPFDASMYDQLQGNWNQALQQDRSTAQQANQNLTQYLQQNYRNAFGDGAPRQQAPGMGQQAMAQFLQGQGVDPRVNDPNIQGAQGANQAFSNLWSVLGANEDSAQQGRLANAQTSLNDTLNRINAAGLGGTSAIGLQRGRAQQDYNQRVDDRAYQDWQAQQQIAQQQALMNWQRQNEVGDSNVANQNSFVSNQLSALLGLLPQLAGTNLNLPGLDALGMGQPQAAPAVNPNIPYWTG